MVHLEVCINTVNANMSYVFHPHDRPVLGHVMVVGVGDNDREQERFFVSVHAHVVLMHWVTTTQLSPHCDTLAMSV